MHPERRGHTTGGLTRRAGQEGFGCCAHSTAPNVRSAQAKGYFPGMSLAALRWADIQERLQAGPGSTRASTHLLSTQSPSARCSSSCVRSPGMGLGCTPPRTQASAVFLGPACTLCTSHTWTTSHTVASVCEVACSGCTGAEAPAPHTGVEARALREPTMRTRPRLHAVYLSPLCFLRGRDLGSLPWVVSVPSSTLLVHPVSSLGCFL